MPRVTPGRLHRVEREIAQHIAAERTARDWTYEDLAKRMTDAGCKINAVALRKIEQSDPPRRITVEEFAAIVKVFGGSTLKWLMPEQERAEMEINGSLIDGPIRRARIDELERELAVERLEYEGFVSRAADRLRAMDDDTREDVLGVHREVALDADPLYTATLNDIVERVSNPRDALDAFTRTSGHTSGKG